MKRIPVRLPGGCRYPVFVGRGIELAPHLGPLAGRRVIVAYDRRLEPPRLPGATYVPLASGEPAKTFSSWRALIDRLIGGDTGAPLLLVAYGGGTTGDVTGFAAATYRRGVPFVQVPTTLLAMVDASVGGKTAIDHPKAKNMIGAFHQPVAVVADIDRLATLPGRHFRAGLAEVVKHGVLGDHVLFGRMESRPQDYAEWRGRGVDEAVERSVKLKARIVEEDERETKGVREFLNLGHTLGHALEAVRGFRGLLHGEAVAIGMVAAARISERLTGFGEAARIEALLARFGLPVRIGGDSARSLIAAARLDKKRRTGRLRMTLVKAIGCVTVVDGIDERLFAEVCRGMGASR